MNNINIIYPYKDHEHGPWVFDDKRHGLSKEPFVGTANSIIDYLVRGLDDPQKGFSLVFSDRLFKDADLSLELVGEESGGHTYYCPVLDAHGWLCPALMKYFKEAPQFIFADAA